MAIELAYDDLMKTVEKRIAEKGVFFTAKDKTKVTLRPLMLLNDQELKTVKVLMDALTKDDVDFDKKAETIDRILVCAADKKQALQKSLADFPLEIRAEIFHKWMGDDDEQGEASGSES